MNSPKPYRYLYIYPHPDDESFGPAGVMHFQARNGHQVSLLTLTRGGATKIRHDLGLTVEQMGGVREREMQDVAKTLNLTRLIVTDLPDGKLAEIDPLIIENTLIKQIEKLQPDIIVSYPVHGISGFHDHLVTHAAVKRVYITLKQNGATYLKRLAFTTLRESEDLKDMHFPLNGSSDELIDCIINVEEEDLIAHQNALRCYKSYEKVIREVGIIDFVGKEHLFEVFGEEHTPPLKSLHEGL